ncbi:transposase and inactivated derivatives-like protein [Methylocaldum marinum]|uniref:Transposase and inactivated derivatives-like protein n=1 Tax=Methylocaldum marinum TaxID=1432792 RepID=A0A250KVE0_9GAMM|nr:IS630 transposase-related protein [Methylocaldum marinum]BBA35643.1 transposase and inactivated derivatives-like protein [Methylocaldum marinum]
MKAYSLDLRIRMFSYALTHSVRKTAALFRVSPNTVHVLKKLFIETGQLAPKPSHAGRPRAISAEGELYLQALLREEVDLTLEELRERYADTYGVTVSVGTMFNTLRRLRITRKKSPPTTPRRTARSIKPKPTTITTSSMPSPSTSASTSMKPVPV